MTTHRRRTGACALLAWLAFSSLAWAQVGRGVPAPAAPAAPAAQPEAPKDPLGRDTPRGTVLGFLRAARDGNDEISQRYLDSNLRGQAAVELAHKLYVVLDSRLPTRLAELSSRPEGAPDNPLRPDEDVVGIINTTNGPFDLVLERITRGDSAPVWLFSRETLSHIPEAYDEIDLLTLDRFLPAILKIRLVGIRLFEWLALFFVLPACYRMLGALDWLVKPFVLLWRRRSGASTANVDVHVPELVRLVVMGIVIRWLLDSIDLPLLERQFWAAIASVMLITAFGWSLLLLNAYVEKRIHRRFGGETLSLLRLGRRFADVLAVAVCFLLVLHYFGFDPTAALAGLGIGGIAVALAAQKTLENVIAGLSLILDKAVAVGDSLKFGETVGTVDYIGLRSTRIRTLDRTILSVPNGQIASTGIETLSARDKFWFHHFIGLRYETTAAQMRVVIEHVDALLRAHASVESGTVRVRFFRLGAFSLDVEVFAYVFAGDLAPFLEIQQELLLRIMETIAAAGTAVALPSQTLHVAEGRVPGPSET